MRPNAIAPHICGVQIRFRGVEDHTVDRGLRCIFVILDVRVEIACRVDGEDIAITSVFVKWIAINVKGRLFGS